jgi:hypothetical protein
MGLVVLITNRVTNETMFVARQSFFLLCHSYPTETELKDSRHHVGAYISELVARETLVTAMDEETTG